MQESRRLENRLLEEHACAAKPRDVRILKEGAGRWYRTDLDRRVLPVANGNGGQELLSACQYCGKSLA